MNWHRLFTADLPRKGLALVLACLLWYVTNEQVSKPAPRTFTVVDAAAVGSDSGDASGEEGKGASAEPRDEGEATDGNLEIRVRVPSGWILNQRDEGMRQVILFRGTPRQLREFFSPPCWAAIGPAVNANPEQESLIVPVEPDQLEWSKENLAATLLDAVKDPQSPITLEFSKATKTTVNLTPALLEFDGEVAPGYALARDETRFEPNQIELQGPVEEIRALREQLRMANEAAEAGGGRPRLQFLQRIALDPTVRQDVTRRLRLTESLRRKKVRMDVDSIQVTVPVYVQAQVQWLPEQPAMYGEAPGGSEWAQESWSPKLWIARLDLPPAEIRFDEVFITENVQFYLPMNEIREDASDYFELPILWVIEGVQDKEAEKFYREHLVITQANGEPLPLVRVKRVPKLDPTPSGVQDDE